MMKSVHSRPTNESNYGAFRLPLFCLLLKQFSRNFSKHALLIAACWWFAISMSDCKGGVSYLQIHTSEYPYTALLVFRYRLAICVRSEIFVSILQLHTREPVEAFSWTHALSTSTFDLLVIDLHTIRSMSVSPSLFTDFLFYLTFRFLVIVTRVRSVSWFLSFH